MNASELRRSFTGFFEERGHEVVPSASLIPHDPDLLFTVAGMVPFKPYFLGEEPPPWKRATSIQRCLRAGGKHNDLDDVGRDGIHLSFFEMLGNFSFGDYFKADAIPYAWEYVTEILGLDPARLWVTVHLSDDEAAGIWLDQTIAEGHLQRLDEDNYWQMADTGPCGPCSEIFWDVRPDDSEGGGPAADPDRYVEIWNLVFMQYERRDDGTTVDLPQPNIDTGMGLERVLAVLAQVDSVYDTDEFVQLMATATGATGVRYGADERADVSLRIIVEHARAMTFLIGDGVIPSNEDRGYVLRRIIRRASRHSYLLGTDDLVTPPMVDAVVSVMGGDHPELGGTDDQVRSVVEREEEAFRRTLRTGSSLLDTQLEGLREGDTLSGDVAFLLHDTYGFPLEVTEEVAGEAGIEVDRVGFDAAMDQQRRRAREARGKADGGAADDLYRELLDRHGPTEFVGRDTFDVTAEVLAVVEDGDGSVEVFLDRSPFYAEAGGQVGDTGEIVTDTGTAEVTDTTYAAAGLYRHHARVVHGHLDSGQTASARIDVERRDAIRRNHTGTHILHWALRDVIGEQARQQGSLVAPDRLRFDFNHHAAITDDELEAIEDLANREILGDAPVRHYETTREQAEQVGAIAFFGEKYGDVVRVLEAGQHSVELCGGTHVRALGEIGPLRIVSEGSIGSNLRRVEALTGHGTVELLRKDERELARAAEVVGVPTDDLVAGVEKRMGEMAALRDEVQDLRRRLATGQAGELAGSAVDGVVVSVVDGLDSDALRDLAIVVRDKHGVSAVVLAGEAGGAVAMVAATESDSGLDARELIADAARTVGGGGGGNPELAIAGGNDVSKIDEALDQVRSAAGG